MSITEKRRKRLRICIAAASVSLQTLVADAMPAGSTSHNYDILRNGKPVGTHYLELTSRGDLIEASVESNIEVRILGVPIYRLRYTASETWDGEGLLRLEVSADRGGKRLALSGGREGALFRWTTSDGDHQDVRLPVYPTNHWNAGVLEQERVLNTLTGGVDPVEIVPLGTTLIELPSATLAAERYRYTGGLRLESWYDRAGRWLGMRFGAEDGSTIEYLCRDCTGEGYR